MSETMEDRGISCYNMQLNRRLLDLDRLRNSFSRPYSSSNTDNFGRMTPVRDSHTRRVNPGRISNTSRRITRSNTSRRMLADRSSNSRRMNPGRNSNTRERITRSSNQRSTERRRRRRLSSSAEDELSLRMIARLRQRNRGIDRRRTPESPRPSSSTTSSSTEDDLSQQIISRFRRRNRGIDRRRTPESPQLSSSASSSTEDYLRFRLLSRLRQQNISRNQRRRTPDRRQQPSSSSPGDPFGDQFADQMLVRFRQPMTSGDSNSDSTPTTSSSGDTSVVESPPQTTSGLRRASEGLNSYPNTPWISSVPDVPPEGNIPRPSSSTAYTSYARGFSALEPHTPMNRQVMRDDFQQSSRPMSPPGPSRHDSPVLLPVPPPPRYTVPTIPFMVQGSAHGGPAVRTPFDRGNIMGMFRDEFNPTQRSVQEFIVHHGMGSIGVGGRPRQFIDLVHDEEPAPPGPPAPRKRRVNMTTTQIKEAVEKSPRHGADNTFLREHSCCICLNSYRDILLQQNHLVMTKCGHVFCGPCATKAIVPPAKTRCPYCRVRMGGPNFYFRLHLPVHPMFQHKYKREIKREGE